MRADVLLEIKDHLLAMVKILDNEKNGHGEGEQAGQSSDNFKTKAFIKLYLFHRLSRERKPVLQS